MSILVAGNLGDTHLLKCHHSLNVKLQLLPSTEKHLGIGRLMLFRPSLFLTKVAMASIVTIEEAGTVGIYDREEAKSLVMIYMPKMYNNRPKQVFYDS